MAAVRFLGDVVASFAFIVSIDVVGRHSGVVIGLGVSVIMVFLCFFAQSVAMSQCSTCRSDENCSRVSD